MNKQTQEALEMARQHIQRVMSVDKNTQNYNWSMDILKTIDDALEQPAQEPTLDVARIQEDGSVEWRPNLARLPVGTKLYIHDDLAGVRFSPWQGLTDDEISEISDRLYLVSNGETDDIAFTRAIEQASAKKNGVK